MNKAERTEVTRRAQAGDRAAQARILDALHGMLYRLAEGISSHDIDELMQEGRLAVLVALPRYNPAYSLTTYFGQRCRGEMLDYARKQSHTGTTGNGKRWGRPAASIDSVRVESDHSVGVLTLADMLGDACPELATIDDRDELAAYLETLPARTRRMLRLRYVDDLTVAETAERFGVSSATVANWLRNARQLITERARRFGRDCRGLDYRQHRPHAA